jgi:WD40 repeat protein
MYNGDKYQVYGVAFEIATSEVVPLRGSKDGVLCQVLLDDHIVGWWPAHSGIIPMAPDGRSWLDDVGNNTLALCAGPKVVARLPWLGHYDFGTGPRFAPDSTAFAIVLEEEIGLYETGAGKKVLTLPLHGFTSGFLAFAHEGKSFVWVGYAKRARRLSTIVKVFDVATGKEKWMCQIPQRDMVNHGALSPDGSILAAVHDVESQRCVQLWDVATGKNVAVFHGHTEPISALAFTADGRWLITASADCAVRLRQVPDR